jgi:hypothetical protein
VPSENATTTAEKGSAAFETLNRAGTHDSALFFHVFAAIVILLWLDQKEKNKATLLSDSPLNASTSCFLAA